jgi:hypothetical protein
MKHETIMNFLLSGRTNGQNQVVGISKIIAPLLVLFILVGSTAYSQNYLKGKITSITGANSFNILTTEKKVYEIILVDTKAFDEPEKIKLAYDYLEKNVLNKDIFIIIISEVDSIIYGSVLYNCKQINGIVYNNDEMPCSEGNILDMEMVKFGLLKYVGNVDFIKKITTE